MLGLLTGRKLTGRERRKAPRKPLGTVGQLVVCPASSRTAPLEVHVNDYSVTGIGIIHNEPLPLGQKYVIKEQNVARQGSVLFTVVRCDRIDENRFSIGLHASSLLQNNFQHSQSGKQKGGVPVALLVVTLLLGVASAIYWWDQIPSTLTSLRTLAP